MKSYFIHNVIGHPAMGFLELFRMKKAAKWVHDKTLPKKTGK